MFWIFGKKKADSAVAEKRNKLEKLYEGDRGIFDLHRSDAVLRIWLPVPVKFALDDCIDELDFSANSYMRHFFVVYLYGSHELLRMKAEKTGLYYEPPPKNPHESPALFSRARVVDCIPGLGKNIVAIKLRLPEKMKSDLELLAHKAGIPLGQFVRELLVSHLLGHTVWPERMASWTEDQRQAADDWVESRIEARRVFDPISEEEQALEGKIFHL